MRPHAWRTQDVFINTLDDSLASFGNPNSIRFSPGNGRAIAVRLANQFKLANSTQSISAQVTAGPQRPWCNNEYIFVANVPHNTSMRTLKISGSKNKTSTSTVIKLPFKWTSNRKSIILTSYGSPPVRKTLKFNSSEAAKATSKSKLKQLNPYTTQTQCFVTQSSCIKISK